MNIVKALVERVRWVGSARTSASAVAHSFVSRVAILVVNIATGIIVARTLGPAGRGAAAAIALWPVMISALLTFGVPAALRYEVRQRRSAATDLFPSAIVISAVLGLPAFAVGLALMPHLLHKYPPPVVLFAQWMMLFSPLILLNATLQAFYESQGDFKRSNAMIYIPPVLTLVALTIMATAHRTSPYSVVLSYEAPFALMTVATLVAQRRLLRVPHRMNDRIQSLLHYGVRAYGIDILNSLAAQIDQAMVVGLLSASNFGLYAVALSGSRVLSVAATSLNAVLFPKAAGLEKLQAIALVNRSARTVFAATSIAAVACIAVLPVIIPIAYGAEYSAIIGITRLLIVAVLFSATTATLTQSFMATGQPGIVTLLQGAGVCMTVPLMFALIPRFGLTGAAYAVDISNAIRLALVMIAYPVFLHQPLPTLLLQREDVHELLRQLHRAPAS